jgi:hypothetical protein
MKLIQRGISGHEQNCQQRPSQVKFSSAGSQTAQDENAQNAVLGDMPAFADEVVQEFQRFEGSMWQKKTQHRDDNDAGVVRCEHAGRESRNHDGPNKRWPPIFQPPHFLDQPRERKMQGREGKRQEVSLFQPVIWSFARDDNVMDVTFAQAGGGNANELAAFLKLGEIRGAAIAHATAQSSSQLVHQPG